VRGLADRLVAGAWLLVVWVLLWGHLTVWVVLGGLLVVPAVLAVTSLPPLTLRPRIRPLLLPLGVLRFLGDLVRSSVQVAVAAVTRGETRSAIVTVPVRCSSDIVLTLVSNRLSLTPGTLVLEIDRPDDLLHVYVLPVRDAAAGDRAKDDAARRAEETVRALGEDPS
jgi:multicomponent Na+:H+ antiporter subunit E